MSLSMARELGAEGITVNAILPGATFTEIERKTVTPAQKERIIAMQCVPRAEVPEDLVGAVPVPGVRGVCVRHRPKYQSGWRCDRIMSATPTVAIVAPGNMGAGVGRRLTENKVTVLTSLAGRSEESAKRAREAGMQPVEDRTLAEADFSSRSSRPVMRLVSPSGLRPC
jgi:hypothetical protein